MSSEEALRSWISERRTKLVTELLSAVRGDPPALAETNERLSELVQLQALEAALDDPKESGRNWRWAILAVAISSLLLVLLSFPHYHAGEVVLSAEATAVRIRPVERVTLGPLNLALEGFSVFEVHGVAAALDPLLNSPAKIDLTRGMLRFGDHATLAILDYGPEAELSLQALNRDELLIAVSGDKAYAEVTPNGAAMWASEDASDCPAGRANCIFPPRNVHLSSKDGLEIRLRRTSKPITSGEPATPLIRSTAKLAALAFDTRTDRDGLETGRRSRLLQATLQLKSFGDERVDRQWGQSLAVNAFDGVLEIRYAANGLRVLMNGDIKSVLGSGDENLTPSSLKWLWQNKVIALYLSAILAFVGFILERFPKALAWMKQ